MLAMDGGRSALFFRFPLFSFSFSNFFSSLRIKTPVWRFVAAEVEVNAHAPCPTFAFLLFTCICVFMHIALYTCVLVRISEYMDCMYLCMYLSTYFSMTFLPISQSFYLSVYMSVYLLIYLSAYLFITHMCVLYMGNRRKEDETERGIKQEVHEIKNPVN